MATLSLPQMMSTYHYNEGLATSAADISFDRYDAMFAAMSGVTAGLIDIFFVGIPKEGALTKISDSLVDKLVMKAAKVSGWSPRDGHETIASAIGFFERNFPVNYDHRSSVDVGGAFQLSTMNHHFKSLSHSPDPIGLFFSILDQFMNTASFIADGKLIRIDTSDKEFRLQGSNFVSKLFAGFVNWLGHILSDVAGSSGSRGGSGAGRGTGLPIPFMNLLQFLNVGSFQVGQHRNDFATVMVKVFENGYDFRHGLAMAVPVIFNELMIRAFYVLRRHFEYGLPWRECLPSMKDKTLRWMLLISTGAMCILDGADAIIRGGGNAVMIFLRMNYVAWMRLIYLVIKEIVIFVKPILKELWAHVKAWIVDNILSLGEQKEIEAFYYRMREFRGNLEREFQLFLDRITKEHNEIMAHIAAIELAPDTSSRLQASANLAVRVGVDENKVMRTADDVRRKVFGKK